MMLSASFILQGSAQIRAFLIFVFPLHRDDIVLENISSCQDVQRVVTNSTKPLPETRSRDQLIKEKLVTYLPARNIDLLNAKNAGLEGHWQLDSIVYAQTNGDPLTFVASVRIHTNTFNQVGDYEFFVDLRKRVVSMGGANIANITGIRDLNVPIGFNLASVSSSLGEALSDEELVILALTLSPRYELDFITADIIGTARELCVNKGLLTKDDIDFLDYEKSFVVNGVLYEHSASWQ